MNRSEYQAYLASREWALLREAVRRRADDRCERCRRAKMDAVHHRTYERIGHEDLDDLVAICDPCHEFESGKRAVDPMGAGVGVYLAGPFSAYPDWRTSLFAGDLLVGGFSYVGPVKMVHERGLGYREVDADGVPCPRPHGGRDFGHAGVAPKRIVRKCVDGIVEADFVFAWLPDGVSPPGGTLYELGYAAALGRPTMVCRQDSPRYSHDVDSGVFDPRDEYWFSMASADHAIVASTPEEGWKGMIKNWKRHCGLASLRRGRMPNFTLPRRVPNPNSGLWSVPKSWRPRLASASLNEHEDTL